MNRHYAPPSRPTPSAAGRTATTPVYPSAPPSRASTSGHSASASVSEVVAVLHHVPHSTSTFTPLPSLGDSSSSVPPSHSHFKSQSPFNNNRPAVARSPRPGFSSDGTFTPPHSASLSGDSPSSVSHSHSPWSFDNNRPTDARSPRPGFSSDGALSDYAAGASTHRPVPAAPPSAQLARGSASPAVLTPPHTLSSSPAPSPPLPIPLRAEGSLGPVGPRGPVTPTRNGSLVASSSQPHEQRQQRQLPHPPSSARSKGSVAETPSGDLANFHLLKGSPLQSVADFDTPTPSPRTPSASPADHQALLLAHRTGAPYFPYTDGRRFLPSSSGISPTFARAQRAAAATSTFPEARPSFYCRICQVDPCHEITATACGHVFCNACIVEEVRENARCPVCNAAVLLFALLKLDVSQLEIHS